MLCCFVLVVLVLTDVVVNMVAHNVVVVVVDVDVDVEVHVNVDVFVVVIGGVVDAVVKVEVVAVV